MKTYAGIDLHSSNNYTDGHNAVPLVTIFHAAGETGEDFRFWNSDFGFKVFCLLIAVATNIFRLPDFVPGGNAVYNGLKLL